MQKKLDVSQKHILNLIKHAADADGWADVSEQLFPVLLKNMPKELFLFEETADGYRGRLTEEGNNVASAMAWF